MRLRTHRREGVKDFGMKVLGGLNNEKCDNRGRGGGQKLSKFALHHLCMTPKSVANFFLCSVCFELKKFEKHCLAVN